METGNIIPKLLKINRGLSFYIWRVRIGGLEMALFFLFTIGEKLISKFVPMEPETAHIVSETLSCTSVLILGEAILRSLYKLFPRYRWSTLLAMIGGAIGGLVITIVMDHIDKDVAVGEIVAAVHAGGAYPLACLAHGVVRQTHQLKPLHSGAHTALHRDEKAVNADDAGAVGFGDHTCLPGGMCRHSTFI